jgi:hypothetical protein
MSAEERIALLCKAYRILDGKGQISISEVKRLIASVLDDMTADSCERILARKG